MLAASRAELYRVYRRRFAPARALETMCDEGGSHFDPDVLDALIAAVPA